MTDTLLIPKNFYLKETKTMKNKGILTNNFRNELNRQDLQEETKVLILDDIKSRSNLLNAIQLVGSQRFSVFELVEDSLNNNISLKEVSLNSALTSERILIKGSEDLFLELGGTTVAEEQIIEKVKDKISASVIDELTAKSTTVVPENTDDIIGKVVAIKESFGKGVDFALAVDTKSYLEIAKDFRCFPFKVYHSPELDTGTMICFKPNEVYCNCLFGELDKDKDIITGVVTVGMSILILQSFVKEKSAYIIK